MAQALAHVQETSGSLDKVYFMNGGKFTAWSRHNIATNISETGWPGTGANDAGAAKAGDGNMATYWKSSICAMLDWGVDLFWFEAFDEPNKQDATGDNGVTASEKHWGSFTSDRKPKFNMKC